MQASLPIRDGGLGLRRVSSLASSAYLASPACTLELQSAILTKCTTVPYAYFEEVLAARHDTLPAVIDPLPVKQGSWDRPSVDKDKMSILASMSNPVDRARMRAACFPHSRDWLTALPITFCGLCIENEGVRVAVGLRLGLDLCSPHMCQYGDAVSSDGHHGLVCRLSKGRSIRHHAINDIIWRSLQSAECRCSKHEGTIWSSVNRWQAARWCHTHSLVCWKIHGLGCHSGPHLCCIILVADSILVRFCS